MPENPGAATLTRFFGFVTNYRKANLQNSRGRKTKVKFMLKKLLSGLFIGLLVVAANLQIVRAQSDAETERNRVERIKTAVYRLDSSRKTKIVVRLKSGAKLKGYLTKIGDDAFDVTNYKTGQTVSVVYRDVAQVKPQGGSSKAAKYALGIGVAAGIVVLVLTLPRRGPTICPLGCRSF